jgi:hypothetical protein
MTNGFSWRKYSLSIALSILWLCVICIWIFTENGQVGGVFWRNTEDMLFGAMLSSVAIIGIARPVVIIRWAQRAHPQIEEDDQFVLSLARFIGIIGSCVMLFYWVLFIRSLFWPSPE